MISRPLVLAFVLAVLPSAVPAWGDFTTIVNAPPAVIPAGANFGDDTQVNLLPGAAANWGDVLHLGGFNAPAKNAQLNMLGGDAWAVDAWTGSELNVVAGSVNAANLIGGRGTMSGGFVNYWNLLSDGRRSSRLRMSGGTAAHVNTGGTHDGLLVDTTYLVMTGGDVGVLDATGNVAIEGGTVASAFFRGGGFIDVSGGSIGDDFEVGSLIIGSWPEIVTGRSGRVTVRGGSIGRRMLLRDGRTLEYSGGLIGEEFRAHEGSRVNIRGSRFLLDGVELVAPLGEKLVLTQRDVPLEGLLADGQSFRFDLNSEPGYGDYFSPEATVSITLVPEPRTETPALLLALVALRTGTTRRRGDRLQTSTLPDIRPGPPLLMAMNVDGRPSRGAFPALPAAGRRPRACCTREG